MNGKQARALRRVTEELTVGLDVVPSRIKYRTAKKIYIREKNISEPSKVKVERHPMKSIIGGKPIKKAIPIKNPTHPHNKVVKGFLGTEGKTPKRYHPTKGYRKDRLFDLQYEIDLLKTKRKSL